MSPKTAAPVHSETDLMKELNGDMPPMIDPPPAPAPNRDTELTIGPKREPSKVAQADAIHSTRNGGKGYRVTVVGEYLAQDPAGRGKIKKPYEVAFNLVQLEGALSVIKNRMLDAALKKKHPDFVTVRTNKIKDATPLSPDTPESQNIAFMNRGQLTKYVLSAQPPVPVDPAAYPDVTHLRDAIIDYIQTPDGFKTREAARQVQRQLDRELAELNPDLELES